MNAGSKVIGEKQRFLKEDGVIKSAKRAECYE